MKNISIVVDKGRFASIEIAARAEHVIDWWDELNPDAAVSTLCFAAVELRNHLCAATGLNPGDEGNFPLTTELPQADAIVIGLAGTIPLAAQYDGKLDGLSNESYSINTIKSGEISYLTLTGKGREGALYAVYSFLEALGFRWFGTGKQGAHIPSIENFCIPQLDITESPSFKTRGCYSELIDDSDADFVEWLGRNRINFAYLDKIHDPYALKKRGVRLCVGGHEMLERFLNPHHRYPYRHEIFGGDGPVDPYPISGEYLGDADGNGELSYYEAHPEWFGLVNGKRSDNIGLAGHEGAGDNYCTSNEDATAELCKNVVNCLVSGDLRMTDYLNFWMLDNGKWCSCDKCKASGNYSHRLALVVYALSKAIKAAVADGRLKRKIKVLYPAYHETLPIPDKALPDDFDYEHCVVTYFPIERCYVHTIDDPACTETNQELMESYRQWTTDADRTYRGEIVLGEYYNVSSFAACPIMNIENMKRDIPFYYSTGVRHMYYMHWTALNWGQQSLTNYQFSKMLWNHQLDADALVAEFYQLFYGTAAGKMEEFYTTLERAGRNMKYFKHYQYNKGVRHSLAHKLNNDIPELFPLKHMRYDSVNDDPNAGLSVVQTVELFDKCRMQLDAAILLTSDKLVAARLIEDDMRFSYGHDMVRYLYYMSRTNILRHKGEPELARAAFGHARVYAERLEAMTKPLEKLGRFEHLRNGLGATWCRDAYLNYLKIYGL